MANKNKKSKKEEIRTQEVSFWVWPVFLILSFLIFTRYFSKFTPDMASLFAAASPGQYIPFDFKTAAFNIFLPFVKGFLSFLGVLGCGYWFVKLFKTQEDFFPSLILSCAFGFFISAVLSALLGYFGLIKSSYFYFLSFLGIFLAAAAYWKERKKIFFPSQTFGSYSLYWLFFALILFVNLIQSLAPETFYDTVIYHLAVPNYWRIEGRIQDMPNLIFSKMPFNHGLVYLYGLMTGGINSAKILNWFASFFTLLSFFAFFGRDFSKKTLFAAAAVFFSIFHYMNVSWYASNDVFLSFFILCSFYCAKRFTETNLVSYVLFSGLSAGFAMGIKYTSAIFILGILAAVWSYRKEKSFSFLKFFVFFSIFSLIPSAGWLLKNAVLYSNPFYPMLYKIFQKNMDSFDAALIESFMREVKQFTFSFKDWIYHPIAVSSGSIANDEYFTPIFALILPLAFFSKKSDSSLKFLWIYFLCSWLLWSFSSNVVRYLMPAWFAASLLVSYYAFEAFDSIFSRFLRFAVFFTVFLSFYWSFLFFYMEGKWKVVLGFMTQQEYLSSSRARYPWPSNGVFPYLESKKEEGKVLFFGDSKTLYVNAPFEASSVFDRNMLIDISKQAKDHKEIYSKLREKNISRILFNVKEAMRNNAAYGIMYFDTQSAQKFNSFFEKHMSEEYSFEEKQGDTPINKVIVYKLVENKNMPSFNYIYEAWIKSGRKI